MLITLILVASLIVSDVESKIPLVNDRSQVEEQDSQPLECDQKTQQILEV